MNIVFDLGGVAFDWQPEAIISHFFADADARDVVRKEIFQHPDWIELDRGTLAVPQAADRGAARTGLPRKDIETMLEAVPHFLVPIEDTFDLIRKLGGTQHKLFVLSNMHLASAAHLEESYDIWRLFEGIVFSCRIRMVKPERQIYEYLLAQHRIAPTETVFIDDVAENLAAAAALGIGTIQFLDPRQCERELATTLSRTAPVRG